MAQCLFFFSFRYTENIKKRSSIIQDQPDKPLDRAVFWIEHVLKHGGDHLRSGVVDLSLAQYLLLDVISVIAGVLVIVVMAIYMTCRFMCCRRKTKETLKQKRS